MDTSTKHSLCKHSLSILTHATEKSFTIADILKPMYSELFTRRWQLAFVLANIIIESDTSQDMLAINRSIDYKIVYHRCTKEQLITLAKQDSHTFVSLSFRFPLPSTGLKPTVLISL